ncbi:MAG: AmmeMemoRadiSam system protein B [Desulfovibrionaceae bacterium CG1_02_65_16]|nr:MAG: AmmeMemoRadiSam system protein B [Desulfovibrionaceae bacterium CG1_02_65_16]
MPMPHVEIHDRRPSVAGQFYTDDADALREEVRGYLAAAEPQSQAHTILAMAPHAGYYYSGRIVGLTLGKANLGQTILMLGPNHTGLGKPLAVWPDGRWQFPGGVLDVDAELAALLMEQEPKLTPDTLAHQREHSLEVMLPFLAALDAQTRIVPVCVSHPGLDTLLAVGRAIGRALRGYPRAVSILVSSDMSHFVHHELAKELDARALAPALALDPTRFFETVRGEGISMCGVLPMTLGLAAALELGATHAELTGYATSGQVNGEIRRVVGYAGLLVS